MSFKIKYRSNTNKVISVCFGLVLFDSIMFKLGVFLLCGCQSVDYMSLDVPFDHSLAIFDAILIERGTLYMSNMNLCIWT